MQVVNNRDGTWTINYIPNEVGETYIDVFHGDELVNGSPFKVNIFDVNQILVSNIETGVVGHPVNFDIDASAAGVGQLEIVIQDGRIPCDAVPRGAFHFDASFLPNEPGRYAIDIKFNGASVPGPSPLVCHPLPCRLSRVLGSPFSCHVSDLSRVTVSDVLTNAHVGETCFFDINHWTSYDSDRQCIPLDVAITGKRSLKFDTHTRSLECRCS